MLHVFATPLSVTRKIVEDVFSLANRNTDYKEQYFARFEITDEFLFLVTNLSPYFDR